MMDQVQMELRDDKADLIKTGTDPNGMGEPWQDRAILEVIISLRMGDTLSRKAKEDIADLIVWLRYKKDEMV